MKFERKRDGKERKNLKTSRQDRFPTTAKQKNLKKGQEYRRLCINPAARQKETQEVALHHGIVSLYYGIAGLQRGIVNELKGVLCGQETMTPHLMRINLIIGGPLKRRAVRNEHYVPRSYMAIATPEEQKKGSRNLQRDFLLEQYRQAWSQRQREANVQMQLLGIGNTVLAGMLIAAISVNDVLVSTVLSAAAIPICFFLYVAYRKQVYFEDLFSENIEAIERQAGGVKHLQYDTYPHKDASLHYVVRYPKKTSLERVIPHTVMYTLLCMYAAAAHLMLYRSGSKLLPQWSIIALVLVILPACYTLTFLLRRPARIGETQTKGSQKEKVSEE
jgi:hypothetical protein